MADDFEETGDANSEAADAPGTVPVDADAVPAAERVAAKQAATTFESAASPIIRRSNQNSRLRESSKAFAEAVLAAKKAPANAQPTVTDEFDPEAAPAVETPKPAVSTPPAPAATTPVAPQPPAAAIATPPPGPSLDPEIRKLREQLKADRDELAAQRAEFEKQKTAPVPAPSSDALSFEDYVDRPSSAYRNWLETMRGEKFTSDDEFKLEARDFVESISSDVLGVPLPPEVRNSLESRLARKAVRVSKTVSARREAEATAKAEKAAAEAATRAETERVEQEWGKAGDIIGQQFVLVTGADGKPAQSQAAAAYPWLAAEDEPGKIIVDVIRAALNKDGTKMSWQEASKHADEYLKTEYQTRYEKRRALLAPAAPAPVAPVAKVAAPVVAPPAAPKQRLPSEAGPTTKWSKEAHLAKSRAAFRRLIDGAGES